MVNNQLPVYKGREEILKAVDQHDVVILVGETGSGKTTQFPQLLHASRRNKGDSCIAITQPRRVAAISIAHRVAKEMKTSVGNLVGYSVRFDEKSSRDTRIKFVTDGMLLREAMIDPLLRKYQTIIIDEAHERSIQTDLIFGIVKRAREIRKTRKNRLKVVIMSATLDIQLFLGYFQPKNKSSVEIDRPVAIYVKGRQYPVRIMYTKEPQKDYIDSAVTTVLQISRSSRPGDILVFLTGQEEIESSLEMLADKSASLPADSLKLIIYPLFAALPASQQMKVFEKTPEGCRKVILATNIAETSITVSGIRYVVDSGLVKQKSFNHQTGLQLLQAAPISKAQAWQRSGRAGREAPGKCYRLYTEATFEKLSDRSIVEIKRIELSEVVLQILSLNLGSISEFQFLEKPKLEALKDAHYKLFLLGALDMKSKGLSALGKEMAQLPLLPQFSIFLLLSFKYRCTVEAIILVAILSVESPFYLPRKFLDKARTIHRRFEHDSGDHLMLLNLYKSFEESGFDKEWCKSNFIKVSTMGKARRVKNQLSDMLKRMKGDGAIFDSCHEDSERILKCLLSSFSTNIARRFRAAANENDAVRLGKGSRKRKFGEGLGERFEYKTLSEGIEVSIHPSSSLFNRNSRAAWVVYNEIILTSKKYLRCVSCIEEKWLSEVVPHLKISQEQVENLRKAEEKDQENQKVLKLRQSLMVD